MGYIKDLPGIIKKLDNNEKPVLEELIQTLCSVTYGHTSLCYCFSSGRTDHLKRSELEEEWTVYKRVIESFIKEAPSLSFYMSKVDHILSGIKHL